MGECRGMPSEREPSETLIARICWVIAAMCLFMLLNVAVAAERPSFAALVAFGSILAFALEFDAQRESRPR